MSRCPELDEWVAFQTGELDEAQASSLDTHLSSCDDCRALIDKLRAHEALAGEIRDALDSSARHAPEPPPGGANVLPAVERDDIDEYNIIREISRTHFSIVYEATQKGTGQRVALKVLLASAAADDRGRLRFEREVELLALLRHPNIVPIYASGLYGGQYYFVMPFIKGKAPDVHAIDAQLSLNARVDLLHTICLAVNFAHQRGIMHRDLKPSNILVDEEGDVHVLDFGLAKINSEQRGQSEATLTLEGGQIIGTPAYMSPEQAEGRTHDIDIRSDVYSLGVIIYRVLLGEMPYRVDVGLTQTLKHIQISEPKKPRAVNPSFNRELEAITLKALEKEPERRYQSAAALADDLNRFLTHQPVLARSPSAIYHFRKLVVRHKVPFALISLVFVLLVTFAVTAKIQSGSIAAERDGKAAVIDFIQDEIVGATDPMRGGDSNVTVRDMLVDAAKAIDVRFPDKPLLEAELRNMFGYMTKEAERYDEAEALLRKALRARRERLGNHHPDVAESLHNLAATLHFKGQNAQAKELYVEALRIRRQEIGPNSAEVAETLNHLGVVAKAQKDYRTAGEIFTEALRICEMLPSNDPDAIRARVLQNYGNALREERRYDEAEQRLSEAIELFIARYGQPHAYVAIAMTNLARCLDANLPEDSTNEDKAEVERRYKESIVMKRKVFQQNRRSIAISLYHLAGLQYRMGNLADAERACAEALDIHRKHAPGGIQTSDAALLLGSIRMDNGSPVNAVPLLAEALGIRSTLGVDDTMKLEELRSRLQVCLAAVGDVSVEEDRLLGEYNAREAASGEIDDHTRETLFRLVGFYVATEKPDDAARYTEKLRTKR